MCPTPSAARQIVSGVERARLEITQVSELVKQKVSAQRGPPPGLGPSPAASQVFNESLRCGTRTGTGASLPVLGTTRGAREFHLATQQLSEPTGSAWRHGAYATPRVPDRWGYVRYGPQRTTQQTTNSMTVRPHPPSLPTAALTPPSPQAARQYAGAGRC